MYRVFKFIFCSFLYRKESEKTKMPLYQTVMSYVQKMKLGGKSYAPTLNHPFMPFNKELTEFADLMSKLYSKLEDEPDCKKALLKVMNCLKSHVYKTLRSSSVETVIENMLIQFEKCLKRSEAFGSSLESKPMAIDKTNLIQIQLLVDFFTTNQVMTKSVHELLGKIQPKSNGKTPIVMPNALKMYQTPLTPEVQKCKSEEKIQKKEIDAVGNHTPQTSKLGKPKFDATLAWAVEGSPLVLKSNEKNIKTSGVTLAVSSTQNIDASPKVSFRFQNIIVL